VHSDADRLSSASGGFFRQPPACISTCNFFHTSQISVVPPTLSCAASFADVPHLSMCSTLLTNSPNPQTPLPATPHALVLAEVRQEVQVGPARGGRLSTSRAHRARAGLISAGIAAFLSARPASAPLPATPAAAPGSGTGAAKVGPRARRPRPYAVANVAHGPARTPAAGGTAKKGPRARTLRPGRPTSRRRHGPQAHPDKHD
jgi:hypothetical protein